MRSRRLSHLSFLYEPLPCDTHLSSPLCLVNPSHLLILQVPLTLRHLKTFPDLLNLVRPPSYVLPILVSSSQCWLYTRATVHLPVSCSRGPARREGLVSLGGAATTENGPAGWHTVGAGYLPTTAICFTGKSAGKFRRLCYSFHVPSRCLN